MCYLCFLGDAPFRVAFGVSATGSMMDCLVGIAVPGKQTSAHYTTDAADYVAPTQVGIEHNAVTAMCRWGHWPQVRVVSPVPASFVPCVQVPSPFGTGGALWFQQVGTTVTLTLVRPLAHATHPISPSGATAVVFGTGPSTAGSPIQQHGSNKKVVK